MKKIIFIAALFYLVLLGFIPSSRAQDGDFMFWTELKYAHPIKKTPWSVHWATENRFDMGGTHYMLFNTTLGFYYKIYKWLKAGMFYRFEKEVGKSAENRPMPQAEFTFKHGPMKFEVRERLENRIFTNGEYRLRNRARIKIGPKYKAKGVTFHPFVANEFFLETKKGGQGGFNQYRFSTGTTFGFTKDRVKFTPYFLLRSELKSSGWIERFVFGTSLALKY